LKQREPLRPIARATGEQRGQRAEVDAGGGEKWAPGREL
jgi:hypothetical protein